MCSIKRKFVIRTLVAIICATFLYQDIAWANPDIGSGTNSALQVPSKFAPLKPEDLHRNLIDVYFGYLLEEIGRDNTAGFDYRLTTFPIVHEHGGLRIVLDLSNKHEESPGTFVIPCSIRDTKTIYLWEYEIVVPQGGPYSLRKSVTRQKNNGPPSILEAAEINIKKAAEIMRLDRIFVDQSETMADGPAKPVLPQEGEPRNILLKPNRITTVKFEVRRDDGKAEIFWGFRVCQNDARGAGKGGLRWLIVEGETLEEAEETAAGLATFMSIKNSVVGIPLGGGKGDIVIPKGAYSRDEQARIMRGFSRELTMKNAIGTFIDVPAPDKNTDAAMMAWFLDEHLKVLAEKGSIRNKEILKALKGVRADDTYPQRIYYLAEYACLLDSDKEGLLEGIELGMVTGKPVWSEDMGFKKDPVTKRPVWKKEAGYDKGKNIRIGGSIGRTKATGFGGFLAFKATIDRLLRHENASLFTSLDEKVQRTVKMVKEDLKGKSVAMQGAGNVSEPNAWEFYKAGAKIEILQDEHYTMLDPNGINFGLLDNYLERKEGEKENIWRPLGEVKNEFLTSTGAKFVEYKDKDKKTGKDIILYNKEGIDLKVLEESFPKDDKGNRKALSELSDPEINDLLAATGCEKREISIIWTHRTDIKVAGATENEITDDIAKIMNCDIVLELANNPTTPGADEILRKRGVLVIPDILANVGGVTVSYFEWLQNIEGRYWSGIAVDKMLEERINSETDDVFRIAKKYNVDLRKASLILALARLADAEIARNPKLRKIFKDGSKKPYEFYGELGLNPETVEELEAIYEDGKFADLIKRSEAAQRSDVNTILERIDKEFARDKRGFVLISGSNTSGTLGLSERLTAGLKKKGRSVVKINVDLVIEDFEERFSGKSSFSSKSIDDIYNEKLKLILEFVRSKTKIKDSSNSIIILEGDYVLADNVMKLLEKEQKIGIFVNPVPSLKLERNWPLTSLDLRFMRYMLTFASVYRQRVPLDVIRAWRKIRQSDLKYVYTTWQNADITFNSYLPYEVPVLKPHVKPLLEKALAEARQERDEVSAASIEHLLRILDKVPEVSDMDAYPPADSAIRQYIGQSGEGGDKRTNANHPVWRKALSQTAENRGVREVDVLEGLSSNNKEIHRIFRYILANIIAAELAQFSDGVKRVWLFGDVGNGGIDNIRPTSDIDFIIEVTSPEERERVQEHLADINTHVTAAYNSAMSGTKTEILELIELKDVKRIFLPEEIARREGASFLVASIPEPASLIYERDTPVQGGVTVPGDGVTSDEASWGELLRDMRQPESLVKSFVEKVLSLLVTKRIVLVFDNGLKDRKAIGIFEMVKYLKTKPVFKRLLKNLHIIVCGPDRIRFKVQEYFGDEKTEIFVFARRTRSADVKELEGYRTFHPCYIDDSEFDETANDYYPLLEMVTLTLAEYIDAAALDNMTELVKELGVEIMARDGRAIIFKVLPKPGPHDYHALIQRYARLKELLRAA